MIGQGDSNLKLPRVVVNRHLTRRETISIVAPAHSLVQSRIAAVTLQHKTLLKVLVYIKLSDHGIQKDELTVEHVVAEQITQLLDRARNGLALELLDQRQYGR